VLTARFNRLVDEGVLDRRRAACATTPLSCARGRGCVRPKQP